jgi:hypothetical protein
LQNSRFLISASAPIWGVAKAKLHTGKARVFLIGREGHTMIARALAFIYVIAVGAFGIASANYQAKHRNETSS